MEETTKKPRGFAAMTLEKRKEIASKGGVAAQKAGTAHKFTVPEAIAAGKKGGAKTSSNRAFMAEIGRKGGKNRHKKAWIANYAKNEEDLLSRSMEETDSSDIR